MPSRPAPTRWGSAIIARSTDPGSRLFLTGIADGTTRLPTDPIGNYALTLTNIVVGSTIQVETQAGAAIEFRTADASTEAFDVPAYSPGSASNDLRIKVRKGSASPLYKPFETLATAVVGSQSIYVAQIPDE